jgi:hypothetical protein
MKRVRGSKPTSSRAHTEPPSPKSEEASSPLPHNPLAESIQRIIELQMVELQKLEQRGLETLKLTQQWIDILNAEFDTLLKRMQTATARAGMKRAFNASAKQLGKAAVDAARKRG